MSGHHFTIFWGYSCHFFFFFFKFLGISLPFVFIWSVTSGWWSSGLVWFIGLLWARRHLVQTAQANMEISHSKVPHSTWEPLGEKKKNFDWLVYSCDKKNSLKILDLHWHRTGKWTEVPLYQDNPCWDQSALVIRAKLSTIWSKFQL